MIEDLSAVEKEVAQAKSRARASIEAEAREYTVVAAQDETTPVPGLREQPLGVIGGR